MTTSTGIRGGITVTVVAGIAALAAGGTARAGGGWVEFVDETATRMPESLNDPATSTEDEEEKDYAWGDVDQDGDIDLVCVRKRPFTVAGGRINVLFMNEGVDEGHAMNGILADRTEEHVTEADDGGQGFNDATNDRDVALVDVTGDGWLDIVTATTVSRGLSKTISHPRVYVNKGEIDGVWQGFRYEEGRIPQLVTIPDGVEVTPRFCAVAAGDVTGDDAADLYFADYDSSGVPTGDQQPPGTDLNDRLLVNDGTGVFTDSLETRMTAQMLFSHFGTAAVIADMNGDGVNDVVKDSGLAFPEQVTISYNDPDDEGFFDAFEAAYTRSPYFISVGDLNGDGLLDIVAVDDGTDRYLLNRGNGSDGRANFQEFIFPSSSSDGFGGNSVIADLNRDGNMDVVIADVDVDELGCNRRMHLYRNFGDVPDVTLQESAVAVIPTSMLQGTHDVAVFDLDGDEWLDLVIGRCTGTQVWMNQPPVGLVFGYPAGLPSFVTPNEPHVFEVQLEAVGGGVPEPGSGRIFISLDGGTFEGSDMEALGDDLYRATLPGVACPERIRFYVTGELDDGSVFSDPAGAPKVSYVATAAEGSEITFRDEIEDDVSAWEISSDASLTTGEWEQAEPNGTISGGALAAPDSDATAGEGKVKAFVTENGEPGGSAGTADVDGGPTSLVSPVIDLEGTDATISYARWFFCSEEGDPVAEDFLTIEVTNDGDTWTHVEDVAGTNSSWRHVAFVVGDFVEPSATVQVRFSTSDQLDVPASSIVEAGIDNFQVETIVCGAPCPADIDGSGSVDTGDLLAVLAAWGRCPDCPEDIDGSGFVDTADLLALLAAWGPCG